MNGKDLFLGMHYVDARFVQEAATVTQLKAEKKTPSLRRPFLVAAIIALTLLLVGCAVAYVLNLETLKIGETAGERYVFSTDGTHITGTETVHYNVLTLAGLEGSAPYKASAEWYAYQEELLASISQMEQAGTLPEGYWETGSYQQALQEKADELARKYDLKPESKELEFRTVRNLCDALGVERFQTTSDDVAVTIKDGGCYQNGSFWMNMDFSFQDGQKYDVPTTWGVLRWNRTDSFSRDYILLEDTGDWEEWNYVTVSGSKVLILFSPSDWRGYILCHRGEALMSLQFESRVDLGNNVDGETWFDHLYMTHRQMEQLADAIDFSVQPRLATQDDVVNQPAVSNEQTQNGYTVHVKSVETDGWLARITMRITGPEGTDISRDLHDSAEEYGIRPGNHDVLTPAAKTMVGENRQWQVQEDDDGLDNTLELVLESFAMMEDGSAPFGPGTVWEIRLEDLWTFGGNSHGESEILVQGEWNFEITFGEEDGDYRAIQFAGTPITLPAVTGLNPDGTDILGHVEVSSFTLHSMSAVIVYHFDGSADFTKQDLPMYVVMKDGSRVELQATGGNPDLTWLVPETALDVEQVDHVILMDGTALAAPEASASRETE